MASVLKQATNLTGLAVCKNPKYVLNMYFTRLLGILKKMPENSAYRNHTENIIKHRLSLINSTDDIKVMEEKISCGEIEEVIVQVKREIALAETLLLARPWEKLVTPIPKNQWNWPIN